MHLQLMKVVVLFAFNTRFDNPSDVKKVASRLKKRPLSMKQLAFYWGDSFTIGPPEKKRD